MSAGAQLKDTGRRHWRAGRVTEAMAAWAEAQSVFLAEGDRAQAAECANDLGVAARQAARFDESEAALDEARRLFAGLHDLKSLGQVIGNQAALAESRHQHDLAAQLYKQAIAQFDAAGDAGLAAETWHALSRLRLKQGRWLQALGAYEAGLAGLRHLTPAQHLLRRLLKVARRLMGA